MVFYIHLISSGNIVCSTMGKNKCKHNPHHFEMDTLKVYQPSGRSITNTRHYTELSDILVTIDLHQHTHTHTYASITIQMENGSLAMGHLMVLKSINKIQTCLFNLLNNFLERVITFEHFTRSGHFLWLFVFLNLCTETFKWPLFYPIKR